MPKNLAVVAISSVAVGPQLEERKIVSGSNDGINPGYGNVVPLAIGGRPFVAGYGKASDHLDLYPFLDDSPCIAQAPRTLKVGAGWDIVEPFTLGNQSHVVCYAAARGIFHLYSINPDLSISQPYEFYRNHEPGTSSGFTTLKAFTNRGIVVLLGYNIVTGHVAMYQLAVTSVSPAEGVPPLLLTAMWSHDWAKGWTRFAFFQFGGENFFLKTNIDKFNVNIDHVMDNISEGTVEVGTKLNDLLQDAEELNVVQPFTLGSGNPCFVVYKKTGEYRLYRIHSDCLGWSQVGAFKTIADATQIAVIPHPGSAFMLFY